MLAPLNQHPIEPSLVAGLEVILPEDLKSFFYESGYLPSTAEEARCNARLRVRSVGDILLTHTPPVLRDGLTKRTKRSSKTLIKDLSRSGIGILYHEQIFPEERFQIRFQGRLINSIAVRCRRLGVQCYEVGGRIVSLETIEDLATD